MSPHYSADPNDKKHVYHNNSACTEQNNIEKKWDKQGTGNYPLCHHCKTLNDQGK
jgi:hypothetical protein